MGVYYRGLHKTIGVIKGKSFRQVGEVSLPWMYHQASFPRVLKLTNPETRAKVGL